MADIRKIYWDSDCFLSWFKKEADKADKCKGTILNAEKGNIKLVTSAITLTEVIKLKHKEAIAREHETKIVEFFQHNYIIFNNADRMICENARELIWNNGLNPKDSIHVATALFLKLTEFHTFDEQLIKLDNTLGNPLLRISEPNITYQETLGFLDVKEEKK